MPSFPAFLAPIGVLHLGFTVAFLSLNPLPSGISQMAVLVAVGSSLARVAGALPMLRTMRSEEVSRIMPVVNTFPIFVALLAVPILGETLGWLQWLAIMVTVSGAVLISAHWDSGGGGIQLRRSFATLMTSSILFGLGNIGTKYALGHMSFWSMYGINAACLGGTSLLISLRPNTLRQIAQMVKRNQALGLIALNEVIAVVGFVLSFWAIEQGPVSLVSTILSTRPAFVFLFAVAASRIFPAALEERLNLRIVLTKVVSIGLVIGGVSLLTVSE